jgi:hypothetical protein
MFKPAPKEPIQILWSVKSRITYFLEKEEPINTGYNSMTFWSNHDSVLILMVAEWDTYVADEFHNLSIMS